MTDSIVEKKEEYILGFIQDVSFWDKKKTRVNILFQDGDTLEDIIPLPIQKVEEKEVILYQRVLFPEGKETFNGRYVTFDSILDTSVLFGETWVAIDKVFPRLGKSYFYLYFDNNGKVKARKKQYSETDTDRERISRNNIFRTEEEAMKHQLKIERVEN